MQENTTEIFLSKYCELKGIDPAKGFKLSLTNYQKDYLKAIETEGRTIPEIAKAASHIIGNKLNGTKNLIIVDDISEVGP